MQSSRRALPKEGRDEDVNKQFPEVPYLNSKLFECSYLERHLNTKISFLKVTMMKPYKDTAVTDGAGRKIKGEIFAKKALPSFSGPFFCKKHV